jgi:hypothetical protein
MTDVIQTPTVAPPTAPIPDDSKPPISHKPSVEREAAQQRIDRRHARIAEVAIPVRDVRKKLTRKREDEEPAKLDLAKYADPETGSMTLRTAQRARAKEANVQFGKKLGREHFGIESWSDDEAEAAAQQVSALGRKASQPMATRLVPTDANGNPLPPIAEGESFKRYQRSLDNGDGSLRSTDPKLGEYLARAREAQEAEREKLFAEIREAQEAEQQQAQEQATEQPPKSVQPSDKELQARQRAAAQHAARQNAARQAQAAQQWQAEISRMSLMT